MNNNVRCSFCGIIIEDTFYKCLDNYLQICFFDTEGENCFCSEECFCKYMNLQQENIELMGVLSCNFNEQMRKNVIYSA